MCQPAIAVQCNRCSQECTDAWFKCSQQAPVLVLSQVLSVPGCATGPFWFGVATPSAQNPTKVHISPDIGLPPCTAPHAGGIKNEVFLFGKLWWAGPKFPGSNQSVPHSHMVAWASFHAVGGTNSANVRNLRSVENILPIRPINTSDGTYPSKDNVKNSCCTLLRPKWNGLT